MSTIPQRSPEPKGQSGDSLAHIGGCLFLLLLVAGLLVFCADLIYPHTEPDKADLELSANSRETMMKSLSQSFQTDDVQLKQLGGFNLEVWIAKTNFESVSYLDRKSLLDGVGKGWCHSFGGWSCPTIVVRDEKSGKELASYHCLFGYAKIE